MYLDAIGTAENTERAHKWIKMASILQNPDAVDIVRNHYNVGSDVKQKYISGETGPG